MAQLKWLLSTEGLIEPTRKLRLMPGGVVGVNDAFAGGAVVAGAGQCHGFLRGVLVTLFNRIGASVAVPAYGLALHLHVSSAISHVSSALFAIL